MITKCTNCQTHLECNQPPGTLVDCAACGKPFEAYPASNGGPRAPSPAKIPPSMLAERNEAWKDDQRMAMLFVVFGVAVPFLLFAMEQPIYAYAVASLAWAALVIWGFGILRACAYRLKHIEELLGRRP